MSEWITAVTGCTRSGTSLMMRMLMVGGIPPYHDPGSDIAYETRRVFGLPDDAGWLEDCRGMAVKLLDLHHGMPLPPAKPYRFILMARDPVQQAASMRKFMRELGGMQIDAESDPEVARSIQRDQKTIERHIRQRGPVLKVRFEDVFGDPKGTAARVARFCDDELDAEVMAGVVCDRPPECFPGLLEAVLPVIYRTATDYGVSERLVFERLRDEGLLQS